MDFPIAAKHRRKMKASERIDRFLDLGRESEKLSNLMVTLIPIEVGALRSVSKFLDWILEKLKIRIKIDVRDNNTFR